MTPRPYAFILLGFLFASCAEPPSKEMNQAQGAIDAAKVAEAGEYAPTEFAAALDALRRSEEAVIQRDFRLALSLALESRQRAQAAVKTAGTARARAHGDLEATLAQRTTLLSQARDKLRHPEAARLPRSALQEPRSIIDAAGRSLQEARAALNSEDYRRARQALDGMDVRIKAAMTTIDEAVEPQPARRRR